MFATLSLKSIVISLWYEPFRLRVFTPFHIQLSVLLARQLLHEVWCVVEKTAHLNWLSLLEDWPFSSSCGAALPQRLNWRLTFRPADWGPAFGCLSQAYSLPNSEGSITRLHRDLSIRIRSPLWKSCTKGHLTIHSWHLAVNIYVHETTNKGSSLLPWCTWDPRKEIIILIVTFYSMLDTAPTIKTDILVFIS